MQREKEKQIEKFCFSAARPEQGGPIVELPNNIHVCTDCLKSFNSMNVV